MMINPSTKSLAERIYDGELTPTSAARVYVIERNKAGQKSFTVRTGPGQYVNRVVKVENSGPGRVAWIKFFGNESAIVWSRGELALEWA